MKIKYNQAIEDRIAIQHNIWLVGFILALGLGANWVAVVSLFLPVLMVWIRDMFIEFEDKPND